MISSTPKNRLFNIVYLMKAYLYICKESNQLFWTCQVWKWIFSHNKILQFLLLDCNADIIRGIFRHIYLDFQLTKLSCFNLLNLTILVISFSDDQILQIIFPTQPIWQCLTAVVNYSLSDNINKFCENNWQSVCCYNS